MHRALLIASLTLFAGCNEQKAPDAKDGPPNETVEGADAQKPAGDPHAAFSNVSVDDLAGMIEGKKAIAVDANDDATRAKYGIVPGAVLLSSATGFEASELPDDKRSKLVFYCGGERCTAAPKAAAVAKEAGYDDVAVMRAGIRGWIDAGREVDKPNT